MRGEVGGFATEVGHAMCSISKFNMVSLIFFDAFSANFKNKLVQYDFLRDRPRDELAESY